MSITSVKVVMAVVDIGYGPSSRWYVDKCPYCGGGHYHGGPSLGSRQSHCSPGGEYTLQLGE